MAVHGSEVTLMRENIANLEYLISKVPETVFKQALQDQLEYCKAKLLHLESEPGNRESKSRLAGRL
jgi:hypothetical protein